MSEYAEQRVTEKGSFALRKFAKVQIIWKLPITEKWKTVQIMHESVFFMLFSLSENRRSKKVWGKMRLIHIWARQIGSSIEVKKKWTFKEPSHWTAPIFHCVQHRLINIRYLSNYNRSILTIYEWMNCRTQVFNCNFLEVERMSIGNIAGAKKRVFLSLLLSFSISLPFFPVLLLSISVFLCLPLSCSAIFFVFPHPTFSSSTVQVLQWIMKEYRSFCLLYVY